MSAADLSLAKHQADTLFRRKRLIGFGLPAVILVYLTYIFFAFDVPGLASITDGFSGAELEQVVVSALYSAFAQERDIDDTLLINEVHATRPLSVTMSEKIDSLRDWARERAVPAE